MVTNEQWLNDYEARDMEIAVDDNKMQSNMLAGCKDIFKALQWLSDNAVYVHGFKCIDKPVIQVGINSAVKDGDEIENCLIRVKQ